MKRRRMAKISPFYWNEFAVGPNAALLPCPECRVGKLQFLDKNIGTIPEETHDAEDVLNSDPDTEWVELPFFGYVLCDKCETKIVVAGKMVMGRREHQVGPEEWAYEIDKKCFPRYFERAPEIFALEDYVPTELTEVLRESFGLFWLDPASCANKIRSCVEVILNLFDVRRFPKKGKRVPLTLGTRILEFDDQNRDVSEKLRAAKWIGNAGSHPGVVSRSDLLDGFRILQYSITKLFSDEDDVVHGITKEINKSRKPRSTKARPPF